MTSLDQVYSLHVDGIHACVLVYLKLSLISPECPLMLLIFTT